MGTQASTDFNNPPSTPRGVHGYVLAYIPGGGGATAPLFGAVVRVGTNPLFLNRAVTNGDGYFSIYYSSQSPGEFLAPNPAYDIRISGTLDGCHYSWGQDLYVIWLPLGGYITGAEWDNGILRLTSTDPGACQP